MATDSQIEANRKNSQLSTGPVTPEGKAASAANRGYHYLSGDAAFRVLPDESQQEFDEHLQHLRLAYSVSGASEPIEHDLLQRMAEHDWMRRRAVRLLGGQFDCENLSDPLPAARQKTFALMLRYETMHERAFHKLLDLLLNHRAEKKKEQIGFERQKQQNERHTQSQKVAPPGRRLQTNRASGPLPAS